VLGVLYEKSPGLSKVGEGKNGKAGGWEWCKEDWTEKKEREEGEAVAAERISQFPLRGDQATYLCTSREYQFSASRN
jgi:hypothetical protein